MDVLRIVGVALGCIKALVNLLDTNRRLASALSNGLDFVKNDLDMIKGHFEEDKELHLQPQMQLKLQELAYDIDDFVHDLCIPGPCGGFVLSTTGLDKRDQYIARIEYFKSCAKDLEKKLENSSERLRSGDSATPAICSASSSAGATGICDALKKKHDLVGMARPKQEIIDLLSRPDGPLRAISIVGCSGLGKTALASAIYHDLEIEDEFDVTAWIVASNHSPAVILEKILREAGLASASGSTSEASQHIPRNKRYLFFIDDVQQRGIVWKDITEAFRENNMGSRIILTTRAPSVAAACSPGSYMYRMKCLGEEESEELLWTKATNCPEAPVYLPRGPENIFMKCGGLPQALINAGECLSMTGLDLKRRHCEAMTEKLGDYLVDDDEVAFLEMRRALVQCYDKLPNHDHRNCLLYISIFPRGHEINSKGLVRKLIAEELVEKNGRIFLDELIDHSMIEEVLFPDGSKLAVETCKAHSIMLEFIIKKAVSRNFVSLIHKDKLQRSSRGRLRRLTVQCSHGIAHTGLKKEEDLSSLRSLTIFNSGIMDFKGCRMMRVLDLEGCSWLNKEVVDDICELVFLKYLSLRKTGITILPTKLKKLKCLQTLDIRDTEVEILPIEVILLPQLAFLFGRFEVAKLDNKYKKRFEEFLKNESELHTLDGIVINRTRTFETIILHARKLEKVNISFKGDRSIALNLASILVSSLLERFKDIQYFESLCLDSVSIDFNGLSYDFLGSVEAAGAFTSIELRRNLAKLPEADTISQLTNLTKLHLFSTGLSIEELAILQTLQYLEYLKLEEDKAGSWDGEFVVQAGGFKNLHSLSLEAPKLPKVQFAQRSMTCLNSLQLICPGSPPNAEDISHLAKLNEVILHHLVPDETVQAWKDAAKLHTNKPFVKKQPKPKSSAP